MNFFVSNIVEMSMHKICSIGNSVRVKWLNSRMSDHCYKNVVDACIIIDISLRGKNLDFMLMRWHYQRPYSKLHAGWVPSKSSWLHAQYLKLVEKYSILGIWYLQYSLTKLNDLCSSAKYEKCEKLQIYDQSNM